MLDEAVVIIDILNSFIEIIARLVGVNLIRKLEENLFPKDQPMVDENGIARAQPTNTKERAQKLMEAITQKMIDDFGFKYVEHSFQKFYEITVLKYRGDTEPLRIFFDLVPTGILEDEKKKFLGKVTGGYWKATF